MAIDNQFGKGIGLAAGFDLSAQKPLDSRIAVNTIAERDAHVENDRAYEGMLVYVDETKKNYQLVNGVWIELLKAEKNRLDLLEAQLNGGGGTGGSGVLAELQDAIDDVNDRLEEGGDIENRISQNESDIDGLQGLVGHPVQAGEGEDGDIPATGLHLALDNAKEELEQAILTEKDRAEKQETAIRQEMATAIGQHAAEGVEASGLRKEMDDAVAVEKQRAEDAESGLQDAINAINNTENGILAQAKALDKNDRDAQALVDKAQDERIQALEDANGESGTITQAIAAAQKAADDAQAAADNAQDAAGAAQADADALEKRLDNEGGIVDRIEANEVFVTAQPAIDQAQNDRLKALEDANKEGGAVKEAIDAAQKAADDAQADVDAIEQRLDVEGGLVDRLEAAEAFVAAHDDTARDQKIDDNKAAIDKLNGAADEAGSVAKAVKDAVDAEATARGNADSVLSDRIAVFEANGTNDVAALTERVADNEEDIARLDGADTVEGSVKKQIKDAIAAVNQTANGLADRVEAVENFRDVTYPAAEAKVREDFAAADAQVLADAKKHADDAITALVDSAPDAMNTLNELAEAINGNKGIYDAYIEQHAQAMAQQKEDLQKEIDDDVAAEAGLREAADNALGDRLDVLEGEGEGSVKKALADAKAYAEAYAEAQDTALHTTISAEIDADVKVVADELAKQKDATQDGTLANQIADEKFRAEGVEAGFETRIAANEAFVTAQPAIDQEQDRRIKVLEDANAEGGAIAEAVQAAQAAADAAQVDVDAVEKRLDDKGGLVDRLEAAEAFVAAQPAVDEAQQEAIDDLVGRMETMEAFEEAHDHSVMEQGIADNKAAIEKEVEDRDAAIEEALKAYSTTEGMKQIIGNVVNSLALTMENDKVVLKLGGVDGIALTSVNLDIVTDADITEIIDGLDAVEGE